MTTASKNLPAICRSWRSEQLGLTSAMNSTLTLILTLRPTALDPISHACPHGNACACR